ncbi:hypothetical protein ACLX1H_007833 [Fusarium chlamydosporum]
MAEVAGLALGVLGIAGTIDICIKCGKSLAQACKDYDQTDVILNELCVRIEICWSRIASQLEIVKELEHGMNEDDRKLQFRILPILISKLNAATTAFAKPEKYASSKRVKAVYFLTLRETLESTVADLESWQQRFEPSWFQVIKTAPPAVDQVLQNNTKVGGGVREEPAYEGLKFRQAFSENRSDLLAEKLVTAIYYIHLYEFVHKSITPETILLLGRSGQVNDDLLVCLVGFQLFRHVETPTNTSKANRQDSIYQHPSRAGGTEVKFVMQHDIYSLGVCLLEIGLWQSIVSYDSGVEQISSNLQDLDPEVTKERLISLSRTQLKVSMGDMYSKVVETCLTCLDEDNTEFGDPHDFEDDCGVEVGSRYVKKIME